MEKIKWTKFKKKLPTEGSKIKVRFGNGKIVIGTVQGKDIVYPKWSFNSLTGVTLASGQQEWFEIGETRGKAKKPRRSGRKAIEDPKVVDPKNRPAEEEIKSGNMERLVYKCIDLIKTGVSLDGCKSIMSEEINPNTKRSS